MSTLYLIRHGQASFLGDDYDVLSDLGAEQSRLLGEHLAATGVRFDALYVAPRRRHAASVEHMRRGAGDAAGLPDPLPLDELDEFPFEEIVKTRLPDLLARDPELAALMPAQGRPDPGRLGKLIELVTSRWAHGRLDLGDGVETYDAFRARVLAGIERVRREQGRGKTVAVVTSGGPIAMTMRHALGLPGDPSWKTAWVIRNTSLTELMYRDDELSLVAFNATPHLREARLVTYR